MRQKVQDTLAGLKNLAKVEIIDPDLKKVADEAQAQRKALIDKQQKPNVSGDQPAPGSEDDGKGDLLIPDDSANP